MKWRVYFVMTACMFVCFNGNAQRGDTGWWHNKTRNIHYLPQGKDFVLANGKMRFNRALYGTHTAFRVEAGDLPEFALYMPGMGGNCKIGFVTNGKSKWLTQCDSIKAIYRAGGMVYEIKDALLQKGTIKVSVRALADGEGMIVKVETNNISLAAELVVAYGGATGKRFSRDGDIGADPESSFDLKPEYCKDNTFFIDMNQFQLFYDFAETYSEDERLVIRRKITDPAFKDDAKQIIGAFSSLTHFSIGDPLQQQSPSALLASGTDNLFPAAPVLVAQYSIREGEAESYFLIEKARQRDNVNTGALSHLFSDAQRETRKIFDRIIVNTPDPFINTMGGALSIAADAIWEEPSYLHGAVAWRMRLPAWRGPYAADPFGLARQGKYAFFFVCAFTNYKS